tara:strand:+ start:621 stop:3209 length:2589 start_codon:yes stop_codon:yes gene_type:complete
MADNINKEIFEKGYCLEFAFALQQRNPNLKIGLIGADYFDDVFDEDVFEASHAIVYFPNNKQFVYDVNGQRKPKDIEVGFVNNITSKIYINPSENIEEAESYLGQIEPKALKLANEYIDKNIEKFNHIIPKNTQEELFQYIDINVKSNYKQIIDTLKRCTKKELEKNYNKENVIKKIDEYKSLIYQYHHNLKNHSKRIQKINDSLYKDEFYFNIEDCNSFEDILDGVQKITHYNDTLKYAKSLLKSYKHLIVNNKFNPNGETYSVVNPDSLKLFETIKNKNLDREEIQEKLSKVASFKIVDKLNNTLKQIIREYAESFEFVLEDLNKSKNIDIIKTENNKIYAKVLNFEGSQEFGSSQWCISTHQDNYDEYLEKIKEGEYLSSNEYPDERLTEESIIQGCHVFCWDFNEPEESELRQFSFTISSANDIVAAFDKSNEDILSSNTLYEKINSDDLIEIKNKVTEYNRNIIDTFLQNLSYKENILESPDLLTSNVKHPLNIFREIMEGQEQKVISQADIILIDKMLIEESLARFKLYNNGELSNSQMIQDCLYFDNFIKEFIPYSEGNIEHEYYEEDPEFYDDFDEDFSNKCNYALGDVFKNKNFGEILENLNDVEKLLIFESNKNAFLDVLNQEAVKYQNSSTKFNEPFRELPYINATSLISVSEYLLKEDSISKDQKLVATVSHIFNKENPNNKVKEQFLDFIKEGDIHLNKVIYNINKLNDNLVKDIANIINSNTYLIEDICHLSLYSLSENNELLDNLSKESCQKLNKALKSQIIRSNNFEIYTPMITSNNIKYDFAERYKKMYDLEIIDEDILKTLNSSRIAIGHLEKSVDQSGKKIDVVDYITQNKNIKIKPKSKLKV